MSAIALYARETVGFDARVAHSLQPFDVLRHMRLAHLDLRAFEARGLGCEGFADQRLRGRCSQPPSVV